MKIQNIRVDGFGVWSGLQLQELSDRLTVFYGPNEAGKTTLMHFVRSMLYGFSAGRSERYLPPVHGGSGGGQVDVEHPLGAYSVKRLAGDQQGAQDRVTVSDGQRSRHGDSFLRNLLGGIDESVYNNVFAVGLTEIQQLATLNATDAAREIYNLTTGLDRVSLVEVMGHLRSEREKLLAAEKGKQSTISELLSQRQRLQKENEDLAQQGSRWLTLSTRRREIETELERLQSRHVDAETNAKHR